MNARVLIVDDDQNLLDSMRRGLCRRYDLSLALGPEEGLKLLKESGPFAVVLSDLRMPGMDGVRFLEKVREASPLTTRMMLTGHGDLDAAMAAVNEGNVFRFMTKPCPAENLIRALDAGIEQFRLLLSERELLRGTLRGCVNVLVDVLNLVSPEAFSRGERVKRLMMAVAKRLGMKNTLKLELAGMLSQIGMVAVPQEIIFKRFRGGKLTSEEEQIYRMHATVAASLLDSIPRMHEVSELISCQKECLDEDAPLSMEAVLLNMCLECDDLEQLNVSADVLAEEMRGRWEAKAPAAYKALMEAVFRDTGYIPGKVGLREILPGMVLKQDIMDATGTLIMAKGQEVSELACVRLARMRESFKLPELVNVLIPVSGNPDGPSSGA